MAPPEKRIIYKNIDRIGYSNHIKNYLENKGYKTLTKVLKRKKEDVIQEVVNSNIRGRGGAGFPTGIKWGFLDRASGKPIYLLCNADESEPGTFKDRQIIYKDPHQLLEGILIAAFAIEAKLAIIYIRGEMFEGACILEKAIEEARLKNYLGNNILNSKYSCEIIVHRGAGSYICGEETGLIESIEGKRPYPRIKPPYFPAVMGLYNCPTIVNNVETFCQIKHALSIGGKEFAKIGTVNNTGTRIWGVSGHIKKPGYYEYPCGAITLGELIYDVCGGLLPKRKLKAVIPGGTSSKVLHANERYQGTLENGNKFNWGINDIPLDFDSLVACGSMSGSGGIIVMDDSTDIVEALANINSFYAHESCGQCTPCREGSLWMKKITSRMSQGNGKKEDVNLLYSIAKQIDGRTICAHGEACSWPTQSFLEKFKDEFMQKTISDVEKPSAKF